MNSKTYYAKHIGSSIALIVITDDESNKEVIFTTLDSSHFINSVGVEQIAINSRGQYFFTYSNKLSDDTIIKALLMSVISGPKKYNPKDFTWEEI